MPATTTPKHCGTRYTPPCPPNSNLNIAISEYLDAHLRELPECDRPPATRRAYEHIASAIDRTTMLVLRGPYPRDPPDTDVDGKVLVCEALSRLVTALVPHCASETELDTRYEQAQQWCADLLGQFHPLSSPA